MCDECEKAFSEKPGLRLLQGTIPGEELYECREHGQAFTYRSVLRGHQEASTEEARINVTNVRKRSAVTQLQKTSRDSRGKRNTLNGMNVGGITHTGKPTEGRRH